jgi:hypothetical protein
VTFFAVALTLTLVEHESVPGLIEMDVPGTTRDSLGPFRLVFLQDGYQRRNLFSSHPFSLSSR